MTIEAIQEVKVEGTVARTGWLVVRAATVGSFEEAGLELGRLS